MIPHLFDQKFPENLDETGKKTLKKTPKKPVGLTFGRASLVPPWIRQRVGCVLILLF